MKPKKYIFILILFFILLFNFVSSADINGCFPEYTCANWSECNSEGIIQRTCSDISCGTQEIIERKFCLRKDCKPNIRCGNWKECNYMEKVTDILNGKFGFKGYQERGCIDLNGCVNEIKERRECSNYIPIRVEEKKLCDKYYLEVFDSEKGTLVARISKGEDSNLSDLKRVDISFVTGDSPIYCDYCFNGIKDYGESDIDCGGEFCPNCVEAEGFFDWLFFVVISLWGVFGILFIVVLRRRFSSDEISNLNQSGKSFSSLFRDIFDLSKSSKEREIIIEDFISEKLRKIFPKKNELSLIDNNSKRSNLVERMRRFDGIGKK